LIEAKAYPDVSCEILWNFSRNGKKFPRVLKAVALLGDEIPAVENLLDVIDIYESEDTKKAELKIYSLNDYEKGGNEMVKVEITEEELSKLKATGAEKEKLEAENKKLKEAQAKIDEENKKKDVELKNYREQMEKAEDVNLLKEIDELAASKFLPASIPAYVSLIKALKAIEEGVKTYSVEDKAIKAKEETKKLIDLFKEFIESLPKNPEIEAKFNETIKNQKAEETKHQDGASEESIELENKVVSYLKANKLEDNYSNRKIARKEVSK
jgi:hypothetical protein